MIISAATEKACLPRITNSSITTENSYTQVICLRTGHLFQTLPSVNIRSRVKMRKKECSVNDTNMEC